ncbi:cobyric acid synthase [Cryptosporangium aurantiacum]|uniref:Cobyric acid synthase n=1 Tax=Cryptosporangium aurantiacum TaxID=134849 RepID=A0A1M7Q9A6_9ACTN|nr:cobyric acid synthase [Cryptosporangium aurantiacum]SHN27233.1 adenosylcobyric acid synthase (glutamine-hydrolysing) [Cryptosporangium aurantiacum]
MKGALLVAGATSDAGKSLVTAGICRWLARQGVRVAPFKAQNMSNNAVVTPDGGEIGRAQALQAEACGLAPSVRFNPVLLKPGSDRRSHLVVQGRAAGEVTALSYREVKPRLLGLVLDALTDLRRDYDVVICEGAGSPTEINLRATDIANMGLARPAKLPTIVVGDIDRGGVFASLFGTLALLDAEDQALISGFVINKFRGDPRLLAPGIDRLTELTGRPVLGTLPFVDGLWLDAEDSLSYSPDGVIGRGAPPLGSSWLRVVVPRLPRMSNVTDVDALAAEPGVQVRLVRHPAALADADLVVLPGSRATVDDLAWLRRTGLADAILAHHRAGRPVVGICGGFQMLARTITDTVESNLGTVDGLGLAPVDITFAPEKTLGRPAGTSDGETVTGYEIHHGQVSGRHPAVPGWITTGSGEDEGVRYSDASGVVYGTHWHGTLECDGFRRRLLTDVAVQRGLGGFVVPPDTDYLQVRAQALDVLANLVEAHLDTDALIRLVGEGAPAGQPFLAPGAP